MLRSLLWWLKSAPSRLTCVLLALLASLTLGLPAWAEPQPAPKSPITVNLFIDRKLNKDFLDAHGYEGEKAYVYDIQDASPDSVTIRLNAPEIMGLWKGDTPIVDGWMGDSEFPLRHDASELFYGKNQFAPVPLVIDVKNISGRRVQVTGAYLDVERSVTDLEPLLLVDSGDFVECGDLSKFRSDLVFSNHGWGPVEEAILTYGFGGVDKSEAFTAELGAFETAKSVSVAEGLRASGMDVNAVKTGKFMCPSSSSEDIAQCTKALKDSGLFGAVSPAVTPYGKVLLAHITGTLAYRWTDSAGDIHEGKSPLAADIPLIQFDTGTFAECGAAGAVERKFKTVKLPLNRKNYRIPLAYRGQLGAQQQKRFALSLVADKSSQHAFKVVLQLADGTTAASPEVNLLYFMPRFPYTN
jgi:hypothetical protein